MAFIAAKCPSCGGDIELDDTRESGFCLHCGTKVIVQDAVQKIKISGSVKLDTSDTAANCLNLANRAFESRNFLEAYNYYTKMLEYDSSSYKAIFRKGLCAGYLSDETNIRTNELVSGYKQASSMINTLIEKGTSVDVLYAEHKTVTEEFQNFALQFSSNFKNINNVTIFNDKQQIDTNVQTAMNVANMFTEVNEVIDNKYEDLKKDILSLNIDVCSNLLNGCHFLRYNNGFSVDKNGKRTPNYSTYNVSKDIIAYFESSRRKAVSNYNNLPSNRESMEHFDNSINQKKTLIQQYKDSVSDFWSSNQEKYKGYKKIKILSVIFMIVGIFISFIIAVFLPPLGLVLIVASVVIKITLTKKKLDAYENANLTEELLKKKEEYKQDVELLKAKMMEKKQFETTLKK